MRNSGTALRTAYLNKLNGAVMIRGEAVRVMASDEMVIDKPYILLTGQTATDISGKGSWSDDRTITVDIVTGSSEDIGGMGECEDIANQVCELIAPSNYSGWPDVGPYFKITTLEKASENDFIERDDTETIYRKVLRFRHEIHEM